MAHISEAEVRKIATVSAVAIHEHEIKQVQHQIEQVLNYAERVTKMGTEITLRSTKNSNVFREDLPIACHPEPILAQAPERIDNFFVVPMIIEHK